MASIVMAELCCAAATAAAATCSDVMSELTSPSRLLELQIQEQQHWQQHAAPILARYAQNEANLKLLILQQQQQQQEAMPENMLIERLRGLEKSSSNSSSSTGSVIVDI